MFIWRAKFLLSCLFEEQFGHNYRFHIVDLPRKGFTIQTSSYNCFLLDRHTKLVKNAVQICIQKSKNLHFKIPVNTSKHSNL